MIIGNLLCVLIIISHCLGVKEEKNKILCFSECANFQRRITRGEAKGGDKIVKGTTKTNMSFNLIVSLKQK